MCPVEFWLGPISYRYRSWHYQEQVSFSGVMYWVVTRGFYVLCLLQIVHNEQ